MPMEAQCPESSPTNGDRGGLSRLARGIRIGGHA